MKIEEGYVKCSNCNGTGEDESYVCQKCQGEGVTDWITNAMFREKPFSCLDSINVKRMVIYVRKAIEKILKNNLFELNESNEMVNEQLNCLKSSRVLYDYKVSDYMVSANERHINISIKPNKAIEIIQLKFVVT